MSRLVVIAWSITHHYFNGFFHAAIECPTPPTPTTCPPTGEPPIFTIFNIILIYYKHLPTDDVVIGCQTCIELCSFFLYS